MEQNNHPPPPSPNPSPPSPPPTPSPTATTLRRRKLQPIRPIIPPDLTHAPPQAAIIEPALYFSQLTRAPAPSHYPLIHAPPHAPNLTLGLSPSTPHPSDPSTSQTPYKPKKLLLLPDLNLILPEASEALSYDDRFSAAIAISKIWYKWCVESTPPGYMISHDPYFLCDLHQTLLESGKSPMEDICSALPSEITENRRFNTVGGYILFNGRHVSKLSGLNVGRQVANSNANWKVRDGIRRLAGKQGGEVGFVYRLVLRYGKKHSDWEALEFVASGSEDGKSSVVFLWNNHPEWVQVERKVEEADNDVCEAHQKLLDAKQKNLPSFEVYEAEVALLRSQACLGEALKVFQATRDSLQHEEFKAADYNAAAAAGGSVLAPDGVGREASKMWDPSLLAAFLSSCKPLPPPKGQYYLKIVSSNDGKTKKKLMEKRKEEKEKEKDELKMPDPNTLDPAPSAVSLKPQPSSGQYINKAVEKLM